MASVAEDRRYPVPAQHRMECIDLVNRLNLAFDEWDLETMIAAFTEDGTVEHPKKDVNGHAELRDFYESYRPLTLGVRRQALNHVVDGLPGGLVRVTSYNQLVRVAPSDRDVEVRSAEFTEDTGDLPAISMHSLIVDTLRTDEGHGWRIVRRSVRRTVVNRAHR